MAVRGRARLPQEFFRESTENICPEARHCAGLVVSEVRATMASGTFLDKWRVCLDQRLKKHQHL